MHIEYLAAASWPLDTTKRTTRVEVTMEGSYDILHDISCTQRKPITSPYRTSVIRRFWNTLQRLKKIQFLFFLRSCRALMMMKHYSTIGFMIVLMCYIQTTMCSSSINQTDQMLVHLQSFNSVPENYMIPDSTKNGVPLFYIPPGSATPVLFWIFMWSVTSTVDVILSHTIILCTKQTFQQLDQVNMGLHVTAK